MKIIEELSSVNGKFCVIKDVETIVLLTLMIHLLTVVTISVYYCFARYYHGKDISMIAENLSFSSYDSFYSMMKVSITLQIDQQCMECDLQ